MTAKELSDTAPERTPLSRDRVLRAAIDVADAGGIASLTIRSLAQALGVKPMSVYHYVANKDEILDGIVDIVFSEIDIPPPDGDWQKEMLRRGVSARRVLRVHPGRAAQDLWRRPRNGLLPTLLAAAHPRPVRPDSGCL